MQENIAADKSVDAEELRLEQFDTDFGRFQLEAVVSEGGELIGVRLTHGLSDTPHPVVGLHSACLFGETFHSHECDCKQQLHAALECVHEQGGVVYYMFQEGRGAGLLAKIRGLMLQSERNMSTSETYHLLGLLPDPRQYDAIVRDLAELIAGNDIKVITNNPSKLESLQEAGFNVIERVEPELALGEPTLRFCIDKQKALGHIPYKNWHIKNGSEK